MISQWQGGFQGEVTNGTVTTSGATITVRNVSYNGSVPANGTATFGFLGSWTGGANPVLTPISCTSP